MHSALYQYWIYSSLILYFLLAGYMVLGRKSFSHSLLRLRSTLRFYLFSFIILEIIFGVSFFLATNQSPTLELVVLFVLGLTLQIQAQISGETTLRGLKLNPVAAQITVMRHWVVVLFGALLLVSLNAGFSFILLFLARTIQLNEVNKDLVLWLRAPFAIYACQVIFEFLRGFLLRFEFHGSLLTQGEVFDATHAVAAKYQLKIRKIFAINLSQYGFNFISGHKSLVFISPEIMKNLNQKEFEFLIVQGLLDSKLNLERQRIAHYTIFSLGLFLPYFIAGQGLDYVFPSLWALTVWKFLSLILLVSQQVLKRGINSLQFASKCQEASVLADFDYKDMGLLYQKLNKLNTLNSGPRVVFGLPQPPKLFQVAEKHLIQAKIKKAGKKNQMLTKSATVLVSLTFFLIVGSVIVLTPKYRFRGAAEDGDVGEVANYLKSGMSANSVDILSNVTPTPLLAAAKAGKTSVVKLLLENGADPNKKVPLPFSALDLAIQSGDLEMVKSLIDHGAKIETKGYKGLTALMWASRLNKISMMNLLMDNGAQLNARSDHKSTALMLAAQVGNTAAVKLLVEKGADVRFRDADHDSALELAKRRHFTTIEQIISRAESLALRKPAAREK